MTPMRISRGDRELFALYLPASSGGPLRPAVVMCNAFGQEAIRAHRLFRILGERLCAAGCDVLRFDYFGSGDSAGDDDQFDVDGALADIQVATDVLVERSGARQVVLLGLRLGASLAMLASTHLREAPAGLVLLDPVVDGASYLDELRRAHESTLRAAFGARWDTDAALREAALATAGDEALGFAITAAFQEQLTRQVHAAALWPGRADATLVLAQDVARHAAWQRHGVQLDAVASQIDWASNSAINTAIVPMPWVERVVRFMQQEFAYA